MKKEIKKIIAREVIIFFSIATLLLLIWSIIIIRNLVIEYQVKSTLTEITAIEKQIASLDSVFSRNSKELNEQPGLIVRYLIDGLNKFSNIEELYNKKEEFENINEWSLYVNKHIIDSLKNDSLYKIYQIGNLEGFEYPIIFDELTKTINNENYLVDLISNGKISYEIIKKEKETRDIFQTINQAEKEKNEIKSYSKMLSNKIFSKDKTSDFLTIVFLIIALIIYPLRIIVFLIKWALKTLRE